MFVTYGGSDLLYYHYISVPFYWDTSYMYMQLWTIIFFYKREVLSCACLSFFVLCNFKRLAIWAFETAMFVDKVTVSSPRKRGGSVKIIFEPPFCTQARPWRQMKSVFFLRKQSNIVTWFQNNGHNIQQRTIGEFLNEGKRTTGHLKTILTIDN